MPLWGGSDGDTNGEEEEIGLKNTNSTKDETLAASGGVGGRDREKNEEQESQQENNGFFSMLPTIPAMPDVSLPNVSMPDMPDVSMPDVSMPTIPNMPRIPGDSKTEMIALTADKEALENEFKVLWEEVSTLEKACMKKEAEVSEWEMYVETLVTERRELHTELLLGVRSLPVNSVDRTVIDQEIALVKPGTTLAAALEALIAAHAVTESSIMGPSKRTQEEKSVSGESGEDTVLRQIMAVEHLLHDTQGIVCASHRASLK